MHEQITLWKALKIKVKRQYIDSLCGFLYPRGCVGLSYDEILIDESSNLPQQTEDDVTDLTAYFSHKSDARKIAEELREFVAGLPRIDGSFAVDSAEVEDFGWADRWKEFFRPIKIGRSMTVTPSWERCDATEGETVMIIDPGEAFGTGSHETTRLCMEFIEKEFDKKIPEKCLDIGCGTGILGILMVKKGAKDVLGIDIDEKAVIAANKNARVNAAGASFRAANLPLKKIRGGFDFLTANIIAEELISMKGDIHSLLAVGGRAVLSGILIEKADWVAEEFKNTGFHIADESFLGMWTAVVMNRDQ